MKSAFNLCVLCLCLWIAACGGGDSGSKVGTVTTPLVVSGAATELVMSQSEFRSLPITGGSPPYRVTSAAPDAVVASMSNAVLNIAAVRATSAAVKVVVTDALNTQVSFSVRVNSSSGAITAKPASITVAPGAVATVNLQGGVAPFAVVSARPDLVSTSVENSTVTLVGLLETIGTSLVISDSQGGTVTVPVAVTVPTETVTGVGMYTTMPGQLLLAPAQTRSYTVAGGDGPFTVTSSQPGVVSARMQGNVLVLQALSTGDSTVTLADLYVGRLTRQVAVRYSASPLMLSSTAVSGTVGTTATILIGGGRPPYQMVGDGAKVVAGSVQSSNRLSVELIAPGSELVKIYDADYSSVNLSAYATGTAAPTTFSLLPAKLTTSENLVTDATTGKAVQTLVSLKLYKAELPVQVFSSAPRLLIPTLNGSTVEVRTPGTATAPIPPCVDADTAVTITVIDAAGASASTVITVSNMGACAAS